ncbi:MAG: PD-(D/E)XK nuclease family protein, partial [Clostridia bacterium]|nr:PD-(D/E)XK nuclease family protein [Clostridia bacterium]
LNRFVKSTLVIDKSKEISKTGSIILVHKILRDNAEKFKTLKSKNYTFSYAEEIFATISQLKASQIGYEEMLKFSSTNLQLKDKILDLALIYEEYTNLKGGLLDASDCFLLATMNIKKAYQNRTILFVGFDDYTAIEYAALEQLAQINEVNIINYFCKGNNQYFYNREVTERLEHIALVATLPIEIENCNPSLDDLHTFLQDNLFGIKKANANFGGIGTYSTNNATSEIEFVARDIKSKILAGKHYADFGVAIFGMASYKEILKEIFKKYDINFYIDEEIYLKNSVFYKFLCSLFKYQTEYYNLPHLIDVINSPFFVLEDERKIKLIEKLQSIKFNGDINAFNLGDELLEEERALKEFLQIFNLRKDADIDCLIESLCAVDANLNFDAVFASLVEKEENLQNKILLEKSKQIVFDAFDEMQKFYSGAKLDVVFEIFMRLADVVKINNVPLMLDAVKVVDANNCMEVFDELYLMNCTYETAPTLKADCGIILDAEIDELNFCNKLSPSIQHINRLAKLRLFNTALMFNTALNITYSNTASELVTALKGMLPVQELTMPQGILSLMDYVETIYSLGLLDAEESAKQNKNLTQLGETGLKAFENLTSISASHLEDYFKCPFYAFMNRTLHIEPRPKNDVLPFEIGNIMHDLLHRYYDKNKNVGNKQEFCRNFVLEFIEKDARLKVNANSPILTNLIKEAVRVLDGVDYIDSKSEFVPEKFEFKFGGKQGLTLDGTDLNGAVDRIDKTDDYMRIVDYKTGKAEASLKELYYGNKLQLFLYACAMENYFKSPVVGMFYLQLHNAFQDSEDNPYVLDGFFENTEEVVHSLDKTLQAQTSSDVVRLSLTKKGLANTKSTRPRTPQELQQLKQYSKNVATQAIKEIKSGFIQPKPTEVKLMCEYCPYQHVCLKGCNDIKAREDQSVDMSSFGGANE